MPTIQNIWNLIKTHKKISIAVVVVIIILILT